MVRAADIASDLDDFIGKMGYASNTTNPAAYQTQASGYFGAGSLYARNAVREYQLITLDAPDYRTGCDGIDFHLGSLSYISSEKLVDLGKHIMTNGGAYAVDVMLATTVPELKQVRDFLQSAEQKANQMSVDSCATAQNFVGGIWPKTVESQKKICNDQRRMGSSGAVHDYVQARMDCAGEHYAATLNEAKKDEKKAKQVVLNKNIVWSLIHDNSFLGNDELAEMVMSLTGTYIIHEDGTIKSVPSLAGNTDLIQALLGASPAPSSNAKIWSCGSDKAFCLNVTLTNITIPQEKSLTGQVKKIIDSINTKLKSDTELDNKEKNFLSMTSYPVLKFLVVLNSTHYGNAAVDIEEYSTLIAEDLMQHYLGELLDMVSMNSQGSAFNEDLIKNVQERVRAASEKITAIDPKLHRKLNEKLELIQNVARIEKQLAASMGGSIS